MERKYYSSKDLQQRSQEWFIARMAKFTSSEIYHLFVEPTKKARTESAIEQVKQGVWFDKDVNAYEASEEKYACKSLDIDYKEFIKGIAGKTLPYSMDLTPKEKRVREFCEAFRNVHEFSEGAKTYILKKATELLFPKPEVSIQSLPMQRGEELEPEAIEAYLKLREYRRIDLSFVELGEHTASSPDCIVDVGCETFNDMQKGGAEIKCRNQINHAKAILHLKSASDLFKQDAKAFYQCHHQIWVCDLDWVDYVHYHPDLYKVYDPNKDKWIDGAYKHKALHIVRIHREESIIKQFEKVIPLAAKLRDEYLKELLK